MTSLQYYYIAFESWTVLISVIAAACVFTNRSFEPKAATTLIGMLIADAVMNSADIMTYYYQGRETAAAGIILRVSYFLVYFCGFILTAFAAKHIEQITVDRGGAEDAYLTKATYALALIGTLTLIIFRIEGLGYVIDETNRFFLTEYCIILLMLEGLPILPVLIRVLKNHGVYRRVEFIAFHCFCILPLLGIIAQSSVRDISLFNLANAISLVSIVVAHLLVYSSDNVAREQRRANERIRLYHSQIQPHFIYNSLTAIRTSLDDPKKAEDLLNHFAGFLRGSMDVLTETECIPAEREFETVENYLFVEKTRFGERLTVVYDIEDTDYLIPAFTVQTIAENAVRHGIRKTKDGSGTVTIRSYAEKGTHIIEVKDDGAGMDPEMLQSVQRENPASNGSRLADPQDYSQGIRIESMGSAHVGLSNVKKRLALMCGGTLDIESVLGEGTLVRISIPRQTGRSRK